MLQNHRKTIQARSHLAYAQNQIPGAKTEVQELCAALCDRQHPQDTAGVFAAGILGEE